MLKISPERTLSAAELARTVLFLASDESYSTTGDELIADYGWTQFYIGNNPSSRLYLQMAGGRYSTGGTRPNSASASRSLGTAKSTKRRSFKGMLFRVRWTM